MRGDSAPSALKELDRRTPYKNTKKKSAADKPPPDPRVKIFIDFFVTAYAQAVGRPYIVAGGKDGATVKRLLAALDREGIDAAAELQRATRNMLADGWGRERANIGLLASQINTWRGQARAASNGRTGNGAAGGGKSQFTPASAGQSYDGLAKKFS